MPRKPNYRWERQQRDRDKAAKKAAKREEKAARRAARSAGNDPDLADIEGGAKPPESEADESPKE